MKMGLGKGLDALFGESTLSQTEEIVDNSGVNLEIKTNEKEKYPISQLNITMIEPNKEQPRKIFNQEQIESLAQSIRENGVLQPLVVKKEKDYYKIIAGERRWRAAKMANLDKVPVVVKDEIDDNQILQLALLENIQREDLNPMEVARALDEIMKINGYTQEILSEKIGKSRSSIANIIRLLSLDERVQQMIFNDELTEGHGKVLASIDDKEKQYEIASLIKGQDVSVRKLEEIIKSKGRAKKKLKTQKQLDALMLDIQERVQEYFGTKVQLLPQKNKGKIIIEYYSEDDLQRIIDKLN